MTLPDRDTIDTVGGAKRNYGPVEDPTTDRDAIQANKAYANSSMSTRTQPRAWCLFTTSATTPTLEDDDAVWGNDVDLKPAIARTGTGVFTITWPETVYDEIPSADLGRELHTVNLRYAKPWVTGATPLHVTATVTAANVVTVRVFNTAGTLVDAAGAIIGVEAT